MARTMQYLPEGVFISVANFTLARRDSYLEYLHAGVKQDTLTALCTAPIHLQSLFSDRLLIKAEEEVTKSEERRSSSQFNRKPGRFHRYASNDRVSQQLDRKLSFPAWKQIHECQQGKKGRGKPTSFSQKPRVQNNVNDNYCNRAERLCLCSRSEEFEPFTSDGETQGFDQQKRDCIFTCKLLCCKCSFCHRVATKERRKSQLLLQSHRNKICERCFLCRSLEFCKYCHKCPNCCKSTCRGKVTSVLGEMGSSGFESKSSHNTERGLHPPLLVQTQSTEGHPLTAKVPDRGSFLAFLEIFSHLMLTILHGNY